LLPAEFSNGGASATTPASVEVGGGFTSRRGSQAGDSIILSTE